MNEKRFWVYMMASGHYGALYIGVTSDLIRRVWQHKSKVVKGFTERYDVRHLVWYEEHGNAESAIRKEKRLKKYKRDWKINLIERENPHWGDLYEGICK